MASKFGAVCFDCDSTLSRIEGIDELARRAGCEAEIAALTAAAMDGRTALDDVYARRLDRVRPGFADLTWLGGRYGEEVVDGAAETITRLKHHGIPVYVVSGGLLQPVAAFAHALGIDPSHVYAVEVFIDGTGAYDGFDASNPLSRADGKAVVCRAIAERHGSVALVGDGVTDLAARAGGAYIVGFGGVAPRAAMKQGADVYISTPNLIAVLGALLTQNQRERS